MPKILTIGSEEFEFPLVGENPGYGSQITDWAEAVTNALETVEKVGSITQSQDNILDTTLDFTNIQGFRFSGSVVRSFSANYYIERKNSSVNYTESGVIDGFAKEVSPDVYEWNIAIKSFGDAKIEFNITSIGQLQYKVTESLGGLDYFGVIKFQASVINS